MPQTKILLSLIIILGVILRLLVLGQIPPSLNWDEVSHGYNAYSILKTGHDEWGIEWPTIFRAFGDYKLPVYIYSTVISVALFGLNEFSVRFPSVLAGVALIILTFFLSRKLFNLPIALISAFLVAVEPWTFFLSRGSFEANFSAPLIVGGVYFFLEGLKRSKLLIVSAILLGLSVWTYNSARIFVPLLLLSLLIVYKNQLIELIKKQKIILVFTGIVIAIFFVPMFFQLLRPEGQARFSNLAILNEGAIAYLEESQNQNPSSRLFVNRYSYFLFEFGKNWISHYSPNFLFFEGGIHYQFSIPNHGLLYLIHLLFFLIGIAFLLKNHRKYLIILIWLLISPIAGSLTRDVPHALRAVVMLPIPMLITSLGIYQFFLLIKDKYKLLYFPAIVIYIVIIGMLSFSYFKNYFNDYPKQYSQAWQYGYKQAIEYSKTNYGNYDQIIMTKKYGEPHEFILFY